MGSIAHLLFMLLLLLLNIRTGDAILDPNDFLALQSIRKSLYDQPGSTFLSSWDFTADPCAAFAGVLCSGGRVVSLSLGDPRAAAPGLAGHLDPTAFPRLSALTSLSLVPGRVAGAIPPSLPPTLRFLALADNLFSGSIPHSLPPRLVTLDLSRNLLAGQIPYTLLSKIHLSNLILSHNRLTGAIPSSLFRLPRLSNLQLQRNDLSGEIRIAAGRISIERMDLSHNRLTGRIPPAVAAAAVVYLNDNRFSGEVPAAFGERVRSGGMRLLYLQNNYLTGMAGLGTAAAGVPAGTAVCVHYNCMVPPPGRAGCPIHAGRRRVRPAEQCGRESDVSGGEG